MADVAGPATPPAVQEAEAPPPTPAATETAAEAAPQESAPAEEAKEKAPAKEEGQDSAPQTETAPGDEAASATRIVYLAGRSFSCRDELLTHVRSIQDSVAESEHGDSNGGQLAVADNLFIFHLLLHHPRAVEKMVTPISHFRYGTYEKFQNKCFICVGKDGTQEGVSAVKSVDAIFPKDGSAGAAVGLMTGPAAEQGGRGTKRQREEEAPRVFEPQPIVKASVVDFHGVPPTAHYQRLKEKLGGAEKVRFLQLLKPSAQRPAKKARGQAEDDGDKGGEDTEGKAGEDEEGEEDFEEDVEGDPPVTARCRFHDAESATAAMGSVKEVEGVAVRAVLLDGEEEKAFWERTNAVLKEQFENPKGKGKKEGKKGKAKGKGKGKAKGGKGKGGKGKGDAD